MWSKLPRLGLVLAPSAGVLAASQHFTAPDVSSSDSGNSKFSSALLGGLIANTIIAQQQQPHSQPPAGHNQTWTSESTAVQVPVIVRHSDMHIQPRGLTKWDPNWDSRQPESLVKPEKLAKMSPKEQAEALDKLKPKGTRHLILIRHGQYNMDVETSEEKTLTSLGRDQADQTGKRLDLLGVTFTRLIYSTMVRATETADLIYKNLNPAIPKTADPMIEEGIQVVVEFAQINPGAPFPPEPPLGHWRPASKEFLTDGSRIEAAFRKYFHRADPDQDKDTFDILVCHGNVIRYFVCRALQFPPEGWLRLSLANCSITWLMIRPSGRVVVKSFGDSGHLPPNLVTYS